MDKAIKKSSQPRGATLDHVLTVRCVWVKIVEFDSVRPRTRRRVRDARVGGRLVHKRIGGESIMDSGVG